MAKKRAGSRKQAGPAEAPLHRMCGTMAAHMMLLERFPSFRDNQMRLEGATDKKRQAADDLARV
ncbi:MAG TPA: hypothetical protein VM846_01450, partial [Vicinamibacterales bacterium]|nr:hypothetical protein [Vicinamibacterales bacterium]